MGAKVTNIEKVMDFSTGEKFIRIHRDVHLSDSDYEKVSELLESRRYLEAKEYLLKITSRDYHSIINAGFIDFLNKNIKRNKALFWRAKCLTEDKELGSWNNQKKVAEISKENHERDNSNHDVTIISK